MFKEGAILCHQKIEEGGFSYIVLPNKECYYYTRTITVPTIKNYNLFYEVDGGMDRVLSWGYVFDVLDFKEGIVALDVVKSGGNSGWMKIKLCV